MRRERPDHTLQPTALVNEAYIRLAGAKVPWQDRTHLLAAAARLMRRVLVGHARARQRAKRDSASPRISLDEAKDISAKPALDLTALDPALTQFAGCIHKAVAPLCGL